MTDAWERIRKTVISSLGSEAVSRDDGCGRILASDVVSSVSVPANDLTHYDGYAIRSKDTVITRLQPVNLRVVGKAYPAQPSEITIKEGEACYVTTGSALPRGSDAVLAVEMASQIDEDLIQVRSRIEPGEHVIQGGSDIRRGEVVLPAGRNLRPQDIMLLALLNVESVEVYRRPVVATISVGDELAGNTNTHSTLLSRWIELYDCVSIDCGVAPDDVDLVRGQIATGLDKADVVVTTGGSSMGDKDLVGDAINSIGKPGLVFHGMKIKPGRVSGFGVVMNKPTVMLPGFIHSTIVGFEFIVLPLLQHMRGLPLEGAWKITTARLAEKIEFRSFIPFRNATFVKLRRERSGNTAYPLLGDSSSFGIVSKADGIVVTEENTTSIEKDETVSVHLLPGV